MSSLRSRLTAGSLMMDLILCLRIGEGGDGWSLVLSFRELGAVRAGS